MVTAEEHGSIRQILLGEAEAPAQPSRAKSKTKTARAFAAAAPRATDFGDAEDEVQAAPKAKKRKAGSKSLTNKARAGKAAAAEESDDVLDGDSDDMDDSYYRQIVSEKELKKQEALQA